MSVRGCLQAKANDVKNNSAAFSKKNSPRLFWQKSVKIWQKCVIERKLRTLDKINFVQRSTDIPLPLHPPPPPLPLPSSNDKALMQRKTNL